MSDHFGKGAVRGWPACPIIRGGSTVTGWGVWFFWPNAEIHGMNKGEVLTSEYQEAKCQDGQ